MKLVWATRKRSAGRRRHHLGGCRLSIRTGVARVYVGGAHIEVTLATLDGIALHFDGPVGPVEAVV